MKVVSKISLAILLVLASFAPAAQANASDLIPPDMSAEDRWQLKADWGWYMYQQGALDNPCRNDAFVDIYGAWFGCSTKT